MKIPKTLSPALAGVIALLLNPATGFAQDAWKPNRVVEIVVGTGPGSGPDRMARLMQDILRTKKTGDSADRRHEPYRWWRCTGLGLSQPARR